MGLAPGICHQETVLVFGLLFPFCLFSLGTSIGWCCPHLGGIFPPQINLSGNPLQTFSEECLLGGSKFREVDTENE